MPPNPAANAADPIRHVVVLMLENRSFDQMLGAFQELYPTLDGIPPGAPPRTNRTLLGHVCPQRPTRLQVVDPDPMHELRNTLIQLHDNNGGFALDYSVAHPQTTPAEQEEVMGFYPRGFLPALHALAEHFTICDHWFASVPGPTWTNRFFALSGTSLGQVSMPEGVFNPNLYWYDQDTLFDRLNEKQISWRIYYDGVPQSLVLVHQFGNRKNRRRYQSMSRFYQDAAGPEGKFPAFSFIEPRYFGSRANDDHPPHDTMLAQALVADVYNALRSNAALWASTLFVLLYDEHGGFYDHVSPPAAVPPDDKTGEYTFDRLGVRIPAVLVSPWVGRGIESTVFDHTSLLKYLQQKWGLGPLGARTAAANSLAGALRLDQPPRADDEVAPPIQLPAVRAAAQPVADREEQDRAESALIAFSGYLDSLMRDTPRGAMTRANAMYEGSRSQRRVAEERVARFLGQ